MTVFLLADYQAEMQRELDDHNELIYEALKFRFLCVEKQYHDLRRACDTKRSYEVPAEHAIVINTEARSRWSPTDTELVRVVVTITKAGKDEQVEYSSLVNRLDSIVSISKPHIYRSLRAILRKIPDRGGILKGLSLR